MLRRITSRGGYVAARLVNVVLGLWLIVSAFAWPHGYAQQTNAWIAGVLCVVFELTSFYNPVVRYLNTVLATWLFISSWSLPTLDQNTFWNNALVAIAIFCASLVPLQTSARDARMG